MRSLLLTTEAKKWVWLSGWVKCGWEVEVGGLDRDKEIWDKRRGNGGIDGWENLD